MFSILIFTLNFITLTFINIVGIPVADAIVIAIITLQTIALFFDSFTSKGLLNRFRVQILSGYLLRVGLMFFDRFGQAIATLPNSGADSEVYFGNAVQFATTGTFQRKSSFAEVFGYIFKLVGTNRLFAQFFIVLTSLLILFIFAKCVVMLNVEEKKANMLMFVFCLLPNFAIQSSIFIREIAIALCASVSIYLFLCWMLKSNYIALIFSFVAVFAGAWFHAGIVSITIGYILVVFLYKPAKMKYIFSTSGLIFAIGFTVALLFLYTNYGDTFFQKFSNVSSVSDVSDNAERGNSSYAKYVGSSKTPLNMAIYTVPRMLYFLFSPFPWQWRNPVDMFSFLFSSGYYIADLYFCIKAIRGEKGRRKDIAVALLIISLCGLFVFGWGVNNTGTALRHRDKMVMIFGLMMINYFSPNIPHPKKDYGLREDDDDEESIVTQEDLVKNSENFL